MQNPAKVAKDMERPLYMRPEEAIAYGLADHVRTPSYSVATFAYKHFDSLCFLHDRLVQRHNVLHLALFRTLESVEDVYNPDYAEIHLL